MKKILILVFVFLSVSTILFSQEIPYGIEFQVNTYTDHMQGDPAVASLQDGGFVICWQSYKQDGSVYGIFAQRFDFSGNKRGNEFQVNTFTEEDQAEPAVASLQGGGFVICWQSDFQDGSDNGIFGQMFDASGNKKGSEFQVNTHTDYFQRYSAVVSLQYGGFIICWYSNSVVPGRGLYAQMFDVSGNKKGTEFKVNTNTFTNDYQPAVASLQDSGFVICWTSWDQDGSKYGIDGQMFDGSGIKKGNELRVNTVTKGSQL